jgi:hypothetical protein
MESCLHLRHHPSVFFEEQRKTTKSLIIAGSQTEIRTGHVPNTSEKIYRLRQLVLSFSVTIKIYQRTQTES